jgi:DNA-binding NarL/FixJ family response regulator
VTRIYKMRQLSVRFASMRHRGPGTPSDSLSGREREVLGLVSRGLTSREAGDRLGIAAGTVDCEVRSAMDKLNATTRRQAAVLAGTGDGDVGGSGARLTRDQQHLLELLADGRSVTEAAAMLHVSRRTAHRWLENARLALGVLTTAEAIGASSRV